MPRNETSRSYRVRKLWDFLFSISNLLILLIIPSSNCYALTLDSVAPSVWRSSQSHLLTVRGADISESTSITINNLACTNVIEVDVGVLTCDSPALSAGSYDLVATNPDTQNDTLTGAVSVVDPISFQSGNLAPRFSPDGVLNAGDLVLHQRIVLGELTPTNNEAGIADVAPIGVGDGLLNAADVLVLTSAVLEGVPLVDITDDFGPAISIESPGYNQVTGSSNISIIGNIDESGTFSVDGQNMFLDPQLSFDFPVTLSEGINSYQLIATDLSGNSNEEIFTVILDTQPPPVINAGLVSTSTSGNTTDIAGLSGSVEPGATVSLDVNGAIYMVDADSQGSFSVTISAGAGDVVDIIISDAVGNASAVYSLTVAGLQITSPIVNEVITTATTNVAGTFANLQNSGINVNDVMACTYNNSFYANNVELVPGSNIITATYTAPGAAAQATSVSISQAISTNARFIADKFCGVSALDVSFDIQTANESVSLIEIDYDTDGVIDVSTTDLNAITPQYSYTSEGVYVASAYLTTDTELITLKQYVVIQNTQDQNNSLNATWSDMWAALISGDSVAAKGYLSQEAIRAYGGILDGMIPYASTSYSEFTAPSLLTISGEIAETVVAREQNGDIRINIINFIRGDDGVWRIHSM